MHIQFRVHWTTKNAVKQRLPLADRQLTVSCKLISSLGSELKKLPAQFCKETKTTCVFKCMCMCMTCGHVITCHQQNCFCCNLHLLLGHANSVLGICFGSVIFFGTGPNINKTYNAPVKHGSNSRISTTNTNCMPANFDRIVHLTKFHVLKNANKKRIQFLQHHAFAPQWKIMGSKTVVRWSVRKQYGKVNLFDFAMAVRMSDCTIFQKHADDVPQVFQTKNWIIFHDHRGCFTCLPLSVFPKFACPVTSDLCM